MSNSDKKVKRDFDVWVTRDHQSDISCYDETNDQIEVSNAYKTEVYCIEGCCLFVCKSGDGYGKKICSTTCLKRYNFLPRPGRCWNVWSVNGVLHHQEYPLTLGETNRVYRKIEHESEKKYYF